MRWLILALLLFVVYLGLCGWDLSAYREQLREIASKEDAEKSSVVESYIGEEWSLSPIVAEHLKTNGTAVVFPVHRVRLKVLPVYHFPSGSGTALYDANWQLLWHEFGLS